MRLATGGNPLVLDLRRETGRCILDNFGRNPCLFDL